MIYVKMKFILKALGGLCCLPKYVFARLCIFPFLEATTPGCCSKVSMTYSQNGHNFPLTLRKQKLIRTSRKQAPLFQPKAFVAVGFSRWS